MYCLMDKESNKYRGMLSEKFENETFYTVDAEPPEFERRDGEYMEIYWDLSKREFYPVYISSGEKNDNFI